MSQFRFKIVDGDNTSFSDWTDEHHHLVGNQSGPAQAIGDIRKAYPTAKISIERDTVPPMPTKEQIDAINAKWKIKKQEFSKDDAA